MNCILTNIKKHIVKTILASCAIITLLAQPIILAQTNTGVEKEMVVIIPSYNNKDWYKRNLDSIVNQAYTQFRIIYIDDCSSDGTGDLVQAYIEQHQLHNKITLIRNKERKGALANIYAAIYSCPDHVIIVTVDGDDWAADHTMLATVNQAYQNPTVWMTYGQFEFYPSKRLGVCRQIPATVIKENSFRNRSEWYSSHLRTFYAWLFKSIKKEDLLHEGSFFKVTWDMGFMLPMLEMAGEHSAFLPKVIYIYNEGNPLCDHNVRRQEQIDAEKIIRNKKPYKRIASADALIFSYDRPMQLYALLESMQRYMHGLHKISVLYRSSDAAYEAAYQDVARTFKHVIFVPQGNNPRADFKELLLKIVYSSPEPYIIFAVDDMIMTDHVDIRRCAAALAQTESYGFFLRLGKNIAKYDQEPDQDNAILSPIVDDIFRWQFAGSPTEWRYAHTVDMTVYAKQAIAADLFGLNYYAPNTFEGNWATRVDLKKYGLCFDRSKVINIPINRVQHEYNNSSMNLYTAAQMLTMFNAGLKIDIEPLAGHLNKYPHISYEPAFTTRA